MTVHVGQSRGNTFAGYSNLEVEVCTCGVLFAAPKYLLDDRRNTGQSFYCPNGHSLAYGSENSRLKQKLENERARSGRLAAERDQTAARLRATKGVVTKMKKRVSAGVCPCCNRTFKQLADHMATEHPNYLAEVSA